MVSSWYAMREVRPSAIMDQNINLYMECALFWNKRFMLYEMIQQNASKFVNKAVFLFLILSNLEFFFNSRFPVYLFLGFLIPKIC